MTTLKVPFLSEGYFYLAASRPDNGAAITLGSGAIVVGKQAVHEIVDETAIGHPLVLPEILPEDEENVSGSKDPSSPEL